MSLLGNFPHLCTIQRRTRSNDDLGGNFDAETVEQTNVVCWEQQASDGEIADFEKRGMTIDRKIFFLSNPSVTPRHEILITSRNGVTQSSPSVLDVISEPRPDASAGLGVVWRVMVNENTGALR